jgi:HAD superfamily hydrolase (TIGR01549 family)
LSFPFKAVVFDAFGTLVQPVPRNGTYSAVLSKAKDARAARYAALTLDLELADLARHLELGPVSSEMIEALDQELSLVRLFEDSLQTIEELQASGVHVAVCSNLAQAYGYPVRKLLPSLSDTIFSYEVRSLKPEAAIYECVCAVTGIDAGDILFIGDTPKADVDGPIAFGMSAELIKRRSGDNLAEILKRAISRR